MKRDFRLPDTPQHLRIKDASRVSGLSRRELLSIYHTPGQSVVRKMDPAKTGSPYMVDMQRLDDWVAEQARRGTPAPRRWGV